MARKQESEKFTGFVGEYTWGNKAPFNHKASPLPTDPFINPYTGVDAGAFIPAKGGGVIFVPPRGKSTETTDTPPAAKAVRHIRQITSGNYEIIRPIFNFDFTNPEEYGDAKLHNVRKIQKAKVVLNVANVGTKAVDPLKGAPSTSITIALMCTKEQPIISKVQGKGGASKTTYRLPPAAQYFALGGIGKEGLFGATSKIISSTNTVSVGYRGQIGFNLPRPMLNELENAMQQRRYFSVFVVDLQTFNGTVAIPDFDGIQDIAFFGNLGPAALDPALQPILDFTYKIDNSKIHTGGGITRTSKAGFMMEDVFAGTNSGFLS